MTSTITQTLERNNHIYNEVKNFNNGTERVEYLSRAIGSISQNTENYFKDWSSSMKKILPQLDASQRAKFYTYVSKYDNLLTHLKVFLTTFEIRVKRAKTTADLIATVPKGFGKIVKSISALITHFLELSDIIKEKRIESQAQNWWNKLSFSIGVISTFAILWYGGVLMLAIQKPLAASTSMIIFSIINGNGIDTELEKVDEVLKEIFGTLNDLQDNTAEIKGIAMALSIDDSSKSDILKKK